MAYQPKSYRKFLATGVATAMVATAVAPAVSADEHVETSFTDVPEGAWYADNLEYVLERGIIEGYTDGTFRPDGQITRAEAAAVLTRAKDLEVSANASLDFTDTNDTQWYAAYVEAVVEAGYMQGDPGGTFRPNKPMSRGEFATVMVNAFDLELNENAIVEFSDLDPEDSTQWYYDNVKVLASLGIVGGFTDGTFRAESNVSRAQATAFVHRTEVPEERLDVELAGLAVEDVAAVNVLDKTTVTASVVNAYDDAEATVAITPDSSLSEEDIEEYADAVGVDLEDLVDSLTQTVDVEDGEIEAEFDLLPPGEHTVTVTVPAEDEDGEDAVGEATFTVDVLEVDELVATTEIVDDDTEEQFLEFTVNGGSAVLPYFAGQGFEVEFQANEDVFVGDETSSSTGELKEGLGVDSFEYQVVLTDSDDNTYTSALQEVEVVDFEEAVVEINSATFEFDGVENRSGVITTLDNDVEITEVELLTRDGETRNINNFAIYDLEFESSNTNVALIDDETGEITPISEGNVTFTVTSGDVEYSFDVTVTDDERLATDVEASVERIGLVQGASRSVTLAVEDQFGDFYNGLVVGDISSPVENEDEDSILTVSAFDDSDANEGEYTFDAEADATNEGEGELVVENSEDDEIFTLPVLVDGDFVVASRQIETQSSSDDFELEINPFEGDETVALVLNEYNANGLLIGASGASEAAGETAEPSYTLRSTDEDVAEVTGDADDFTVTAEGEGTAYIQVLEGSIVRYSVEITVEDTTPTLTAASFASDIEITDAESALLENLIDALNIEGETGDAEVGYTVAGNGDGEIRLDDGTTDIVIGTVRAFSTNIDDVEFFDNAGDVQLGSDGAAFDDDEGTVVLRLRANGTTLTTTTVTVDVD